MKSPFVLSQEDGTYDRVVIELGEVSLSSGQTVSLLKPGRMLAVMPRRTAYFEVEMIEPEPTGNCEGRDSAASKARLEKGDEYTLSLEMTNPDTGATDVVVTTEVLRVSLPR